MSKENQIEEMEMTPLDVLANDIYQHCPDLKDNYCGDTHCVACLANALYNAGYRKQEWISVEERLPNPREEVLVCDETGDVFTDLIECDGKWNKEISRRWGIKYLYWMPLPEAPKMKGGAE